MASVVRLAPRQVEELLGNLLLGLGDGDGRAGLEHSNALRHGRIRALVLHPLDDPAHFEGEGVQRRSQLPPEVGTAARGRGGVVVEDIEIALSA